MSESFRWTFLTLPDAFHLTTCFPRCQSFIWILRATASCWNAMKLAWHGHSVLPKKIKATAHHRTMHASHISIRCQNDFTPEIPNFDTTLYDLSLDSIALQDLIATFFPGLGSPGSSRFPTLKPYGILATEELWDLLHWQLFRIHLQVLTEPQFSTGFIFWKWLGPGGGMWASCTKINRWSS